MIDEYILGELSEVEKEAFELHFFGCDACFQELKSREKLIQLIRKEGENLFPEFWENEGKL